MMTAHLPPPILTTLYRCTIESLLTSCISVCSGACSVQCSGWKSLQRAVRTAEDIIGTSLTCIQYIRHKCCLIRANNITDTKHPHHGLFSLLASGQRSCNIKSRTARFRNSFFLLAMGLLIYILHCANLQYSTSLGLPCTF